MVKVEHDMQGQDPEKGCLLGLAQTMVVRLTQSLHEANADRVSPSCCWRFPPNVVMSSLQLRQAKSGAVSAQVFLRRGKVDSLDLQDGRWNVNQGQALAERVFLTTGSHPKDHNPHKNVISLPLDDALIPTKLSGAIAAAQPTRCLLSANLQVFETAQCLACSISCFI